MNVPYNFGAVRNLPNEQIIANCVALGISAIELRAQPVETFLGIPTAPVGTQADSGGAEVGTIEEELFKESAQMARQAFEARVRDWRGSVALDRASALRQQYDAAGVQIQIVKWDNIIGMSDAEIDYAFRLTKALGATALSTEIAAAGTDRLGQFADKHELRVGYHGHASTGAADFERTFAQARFNGANLDIGHWIAGGHGSPLPFLEKHSGRITHLHIKDRTLNDGPNTPFGEGDTPIREVLLAMRDRKWNFQATIEFEYPVPAGSTPMAEMTKAVAFCRNCLVG
jgi:sugar phosphate isomerase/epimerase